MGRVANIFYVCPIPYFYPTFELEGAILRRDSVTYKVKFRMVRLRDYRHARTRIKRWNLRPGHFCSARQYAGQHSALWGAGAGGM